jgi:CRP-like cAMP-binding protein
MSIKEYILQHVDGNFDPDSELPFSSRQKCFKKYSVLTHYGDVENHAYFLKEGIVEISIHNGKKESILEFILPHSFFCSYASFLTRLPSDVRIVCLEDCILEVTDRSEIVQAYEHSLIMNKLGRYVTEQLYLRRSAREKELLSAHAEQRYLQFLSSRPELIHKISLSKVANYLGIHPESLSRIRKKLLSNIGQ